MGSRLILGMPKTGGYTRVIALIGESAGGGGADDVDPGTIAQIASATLEAALAMAIPLSRQFADDFVGDVSGRLSIASP